MTVSDDTVFDIRAFGADTSGATLAGSNGSSSTTS